MDVDILWQKTVTWNSLWNIGDFIILLLPPFSKTKYAIKGHGYSDFTIVKVILGNPLQAKVNFYLKNSKVSVWSIESFCCVKIHFLCYVFSKSNVVHLSVSKCPQLNRRVEVFSDESSLNETDLLRNICGTDQSFPLSEVKEAIRNVILFSKQLL